MTTEYLSNDYEWNGTAGVKYYYAGSEWVAMHDATGTVYFLLGEHLGSTSKVASSSGMFYREIRYGPWGRRATPVARRRPTSNSPASATSRVKDCVSMGHGGLTLH